MTKSASPDDGPTGARAILRVLAVLNELATEQASMSLAQLTARIQVPKASLSRILQTMRDAGYLTQHRDGFRLGPAALVLARMMAEGDDTGFPACLEPVMDWLAQETGETCMLGIVEPGAGEIVYVKVRESAQAIRFSVQVGDRRPMYATASGQVMLAFLPPTELDAYLRDTEFVAFTPNTCDKTRLSANLAQVRRAGVVVDNGGRVLGASGIASPVLDAAGTVVAAISIAGPSERVAGCLDGAMKACRRAGEKASRIMAYRGVYPGAIPAT